MSIQKKAKRVHESYIRAGGRTFVSSFYERLLETSEEIRKRFEGADMETQIETVAHAIIMSFLFVNENNHSATSCLDGVRQSHNRHNLNISPELYDT